MQISADLIESLLWEEEGATLDFKRDQYPFAGATDEAKSELLKDILAFTNAFRRNDAFILIGVDEVKGGRSHVVGVKEQLDDASLQQFVRSKVQRPTTFSYRAAVHEGLPIGIIHIPRQYRPIHAVRDFGRISKNVVYLRRGSATDIATPDEIARMGADQHVVSASEPVLELSLFDRASRKPLGNRIEVVSTLLDAPTDIPRYSENTPFMPSFTVNSSYYEELVKFTSIINFARPVSLSVKNDGDVSAHDVRLVFEVEGLDDEYLFLDATKIPSRPETGYESIRSIYRTPVVHSNVQVKRIGNKWRVECGFGKIQPKETVWLSDDLYVGAKNTTTLKIDAQIFADNVGRPAEVTFELAFQTSRRAVTLDEIEEMEDKRFFATPEGRRLLADANEGDE